MRRLIMALVGAGALCFVLGFSVAAQGAITVADSSYKPDFPRQLNFHLSASSSSPIATIQLVIHFPANNLSTRLVPTFASSPKVDTTVVWNLRSENVGNAGGYLPPGASGEYSWHIQDQAGNSTDTPPQAFRVDDNREAWKKIENDKLTVFWYDGGQDFGKAILDKANQTLAAIEQDIGATIPTHVQIYIYGDRQEFLSALSPGNREWAGGTINETFEIVLINAPASDLGYALKATPHELTHLVIHAALRGPYSSIGMPLWMDEGLAVYHQYVPPRDDPEFDTALRRAIQTDSLFRLRTIEDTNPSDPALVDIFYGEGFSVVDFMIKTYGPDKMKQLMSLFRAGTTADSAFSQVLGVDEDGLENLWRKSVGAPVKNYARQPTSTPGAVPTFAFSAAETPATSVAVQVTPAPSSSTPTPAGAGSGGGLCAFLSGTGLVVFGAWRVKRRPRSS